MNKTTLPASDHESTGAWIYSTRGTAFRLFVTCWLVYAMHFATNIVREIYPAMSMGEHFSFRLDEYANLHPDIFEKPGYGWHINNNPGVSMIAAVPYAIASPVINRISGAVQARRERQTEPPAYDSPWPQAREFYRRAWQRGLDVKFGLAAMVTQIFCMAPISALGVVAMFFGLRRIFPGDERALWLSLLYGFGTPVFFRTGYLNHNMVMGHVIFLGFLAMWDRRRSSGSRHFIGGLAGGAAYLLDNSGVIMLLCLFVYALAQSWLGTDDRARRLTETVRAGFFYFLGTLGPVCLLWFYQWRSFGHPFYPAQHWMPKVRWIEMGYQGLTMPSPDLLIALLVDYRYGLFVTCPLFLLAFLVFRISRNDGLQNLELYSMFVFFGALLLFCSGVHYARLQYNTGIRYLAPIFPFLFIPAAMVLERLPKRPAYLIAVMSVFLAWCMAMERDVERGLGVLDPVLQVFIGGFRLPALTTISRMEQQFGKFTQAGVSPLPLFLAMALVLWGIWSPFWFRKQRSSSE